MVPIKQSVLQSLTIHVWYIYHILPLKTTIFTYIYHILPLKTTIHVGKYTSPMDGKGMEVESPSKLFMLTAYRTSTGVPLYIASKRVQLGVPFVDSNGHQEFQVPEMEGFLNLIASDFFWGWGGETFSRIHKTAYIGFRIPPFGWYLKCLVKQVWWFSVVQGLSQTG